MASNQPMTTDGNCSDWTQCRDRLQSAVDRYEDPQSTAEERQKALELVEQLVPLFQKLMQEHEKKDKQWIKDARNLAPYTDREKEAFVLSHSVGLRNSAAFPHDKMTIECIRPGSNEDGLRVRQTRFTKKFVVEGEEDKSKSGTMQELMVKAEKNAEAWNICRPKKSAEPPPPPPPPAAAEPSIHPDKDISDESERVLWKALKDKGYQVEMNPKKPKSLLVLGEGGFGKVYRAQSSKTKSHVAIKVPHDVRIPEEESAAEKQEREKEAVKELAAVQREVRLLEKVTQTEAGKACHAHIVCYIESFSITVQSMSKFIIVMEYIPGSDMQEYFKTKKPDAASVLRLLRQCLEALEFIHQRGVFHLDIKPENIQITPEGNAKLMDFGIAYHKEEYPQGMTGLSGTLPYMHYQRMFCLFGTPKSETPCLTGAASRPFTDVYALIVAFYNVLTGKEMSWKRWRRSKEGVDANQEWQAQWGDNGKTVDIYKDSIDAGAVAVRNVLNKVLRTGASSDVNTLGQITTSSLLQMLSPQGK